MASYIPRLSRILSGSRSGKRVFAERDAEAPVNVGRLAALMPELRKRLAIGPAFSDEALLASLVSIARHPSHETRWHAAEASTLGQYLAVNSGDRHRHLVTLIAVLPKPYR